MNWPTRILLIFAATIGSWYVLAPHTCDTDAECAATPQCVLTPGCDGGPDTPPLPWLP